MKNAFHKIASLMLAFVLLLSTFSWTVEKHLCLGHVMDVAFFAPAKSCCELMQSLADEQEAPTKSSCCDDEVFTFEGQDELASTDHQLDLSPLKYLISNNYFLQEGTVSKLEVFHTKDWYPPPIKVKNRNILYEVFLI